MALWFSAVCPARKPEMTPLSGRYAGMCIPAAAAWFMETRRTSIRCINDLYASSENQLTALTDLLYILRREIVRFCGEVAPDIVKNCSDFIIFKILKSVHIPVVLPGLLLSRYTVQKEVDQA